MKKYLATAALIIVIGGVYAVHSYTAKADIYGSSLLAYWTLDSNDISGSTVTDKTGNGNTGTELNGPIPSTAGMLGQGLTFSAASQQAIAVTAPGWVLSNATFTEWVYPTPNNANQGYRGLLYSRASTGAPGYGIGYGSPSVSMQLGYQWSGSEWQWLSGLILPFNQWSLVGMVVTPTGTTMYMGTNGKLQSATNAVSEATATFNGELDINWDSFQTIRIFDGKVDDVRAYNRALSPAEIATIYYQGISQHYNGAF